MSEPLNDFLENIESVVDNPDLTDESFGAFVRSQWAKMLTREQSGTHSIHVVINSHGFPTVVTVPEEG